MRFEGMYYIAKPIRQAMERKATGEEPCIRLERDDRLWMYVDLFSESGERAEFYYSVQPEKYYTGWEFFHCINFNGNIVYSSNTPVLWNEIMKIKTNEHEFIIHFIEFMSDYNDEDFAYLQECFRKERLVDYHYPSREVMMDVVDKWHQKSLSEFLRTNELYHTTFEKEVERTKGGRMKKGEEEKWMNRHGIKALRFRSDTKFYRSKEYRCSENLCMEDEEGNYILKDIFLKEIFFSLMYDIFVNEWLFFLRTNPRETLKREVYYWKNHYDTFFKKDIICTNTIWMPFPLNLGEIEFVHSTTKRESEITKDDLVTVEELETLIECYKELKKAEEKISKKVKEQEK